MCGIIAYIGKRTAYPLIIKGLQRLEYKGYDSAGIALFNEQNSVYKCKGQVEDLKQLVKDKDISGTAGMGHLRWGTHGMPADKNAHPHHSMNKKFYVVHNGMVENYEHLKKELLKLGYYFESETDTEILADLIEHIYMSNKVSAEFAVRLALTRIAGAYGLVIFCADEPEKLIAVNKGSSLSIGSGKDEYFVSSDSALVIEYSNQSIQLNDDELVVISTNGLDLKHIKDDNDNLDVKNINFTIENVDKAGHEHFMLKEIHEQPLTLLDTFRGRILSDESDIFLGGLMNIMPQLINAKRIIIVACGTSWHAGLVGEYLFEQYARIPVEVEYASELRYRNPIIEKDVVVIAISQSGETADTLAAIRKVRESEATLLGICNVAGSSIAKESDAGIYTHAGIEIGVASTKAFTSQIAVLTMLALLLAKKRQTIDKELYKTLIKEMMQLPEKIKEILKHEGKIRDIAAEYKDFNSVLYMGRGILFPVMLEGALKLKETSYVHAEGYSAGEIKHGPIALVDENMPVIASAINGKSYEKMVGNVQEVKDRKGKVVALISKGDTIIPKLADHIIEIPDCHEVVLPILAVVPMQIFSYYIALMRGCNVDQPRNLSKALTAE